MEKLPIEMLFLKRDNSKDREKISEEDRWLKKFREERLFDKISEETLKSDLSRLTVFLNFCYNRLKKHPDQLTTEDFIKFFNYLEKERKLTLNSQDKYFKLLKIFYRYFKLTNMDEFIQMVTERGRFKRIEKRHYDTLTEEEFDKILKKIARSKRRNKERDILILRVLWDTGARIGEVLELRYKDIDLDSGILRLRHTKTREERKVAISQPTLEFLKYYMQFNIYQEPDSYVFQNQKGEKVRRDHITKLFKWAVDELKAERKIPKNKRLVVHSIRHSFITRMLDAGIPLEVVSAYVGHLNISTTMIYAHAKERAEKHLNLFKEKINEN